MATISTRPNTNKTANGKRRRYQPIAEINVTPMVDVMLVLLIVFMVAAPLLTVGVPVNLPKTQAKILKGDDEPLTISVTAKGEIFIEETKIARPKLITHLQSIAGAGVQQRIYVRGDKNVRYGHVADVVARINLAGFVRVALVTDNLETRQ